MGDLRQGVHVRFDRGRQALSLTMAVLMHDDNRADFWRARVVVGKQALNKWHPPNLFLAEVSSAKKELYALEIDHRRN